MVMVALYGTGGHASVVLNTLQATGACVEAVFDDGSDVQTFAGFQVLRGVLSDDPGAFQRPHSPVIVCIGQNAARAIVAQSLNTPFAMAVHPSAIVSCDVQVGTGAVVLHRAIVLVEVTIGEHVIINTAAVVGHSCVIEDFAHISPGACLGDRVRVGTGSHVGAAAIVASGVHIGNWCTVGAGAVVDSDVEDGTTVVGNPTRVLRGRMAMVP
jgi:sugar O-acyltransferase (sialic acid O-acetyltransferase NeuD family)